MSESEISMTEFDKKFCDGSAQLIKAAIPYVNGNSARIFTVIAKLLELKKALQCLQSPKPEINICALPGQQHDPEEMLRDLRKYCDPSQAEMIDRIINMMNVGKLYEKYRQLESSPEFSKMMSMMQNFTNNPAPQQQNTNQTNHAAIQNLKQMLSPEQRQMLEMLMKQNQEP